MLITTSRKSPLWMKFDWELVKATFPAHSPADTFSAPPYCTIKPPSTRTDGCPLPAPPIWASWAPLAQPRPTPAPHRRPNSALPLQFFRSQIFQTHQNCSPSTHLHHQDRFQFGGNFRNSMIEMKLKCGQVS